MRLDESRRGEQTAIRHCEARDLCPLGALCAAEESDERSPLYPTVIEVEAGELLWADLRFEQRVFAIQSGIFVCMSNLEQGREVPLALFGRGYSTGMAELYIPREIASTYYLRALTSGRVCSFPAKALRRHLEELPSPEVADLLSRALTNVSSASYARIKMLSKPLATDRIVMLFARLKELSAQEGDARRQGGAGRRLPRGVPPTGTDRVAATSSRDHLLTARAHTRRRFWHAPPRTPTHPTHSESRLATAGPPLSQVAQTLPAGL